MSSILYTTYMVPYAAALGIEGIALFFTVYALVLLGARPLFGNLTDKVGMEKVLIPSFIAFAVSFLLVGLGRTLPVMLAGAVLGAAGYGALNPAIQTLCIRTVVPERRGVAGNTEYFGMDLGYFVGPMLGGLLYAAGDYSSMFLMYLPPNAFSERAYHLVTPVILLLLSGGLFYLLHKIDLML